MDSMSNGDQTSDMGSHSDHPGASPESLRRLIDKLLDETISVEEHAELESRILEEPAARDEYLIYATMHAHLIWLTKGSPIGELGAFEAPLPAVPLKPAPVGKSRGLGFVTAASRLSPLPLRWTVALSAAAICTGLLLAISLLPDSVLRLGSGSLHAEALWPNPDVNLVMVEDCRDARWRPGCERFEGDLLKADDLCELESGTVRVKFANGARVVLEGPATFVIQNAESGRLQAGRLAAHVPQSAVGFAIDTPASKVIDRGTAFGVEVDAHGQLAVAVFEGAVDLATGEAPQRRLTAGQGGRVASGEFRSVALDLEPFEALRRALPSVVPSTDIDLIVHVRHDPDEDWNFAPYWSDQQSPHTGAHYHVGRTADSALRSPDSRSEHVFAGEMLTIHSRGYLHLKHAKLPKTFHRLRLAGGRLFVIPLRSTASMWITSALEVTAPSTIEFREPHTSGRAVLNGSIAGHAPLRVFGAGELTLQHDGGGFTGDWNVEHTQLVVTRADALGSGNVSVTQGGAFVIRCDVDKPKMRLSLDGGARLDLGGHHLTVGSLAFEGQPLPAGEYSAQRLRELFPHHMEGESGTLHVTGLGGSS